MKKIAKNLMEGISLSNKVFLLAIFGLLTLVISPGLVRAIPLDITPIDSIEPKPFFKERGFLINNIKAPNFGGKYWLEKRELMKKYEINLADGYKTNLKNGLYPVIVREAPKEDLFKYYQENSNLDDEYIKNLVNGTEAFAYVKVDNKRASLVRNKKIIIKPLEGVGVDTDKLVVNYHFPVGLYSFLVVNKDGSNKLANWQFRVVDKYLAADIFAVETAYDSLTLGDNNKIYKNITLPEKADNGTAIRWESSNTAIIADDGTIYRSDISDLPVTLTAHIFSGSFSKDRDFPLVVAKNDPYLIIDGFTANGVLMKNQDNQYFFLQKQDGVKEYLIDFAKGYKTNLQDGKYGVRFNELSQDMQDSLIKYYSKENIPEEEIKLIVKGQKPYAYIQMVKGQLNLISAYKVSVSNIDSIIDIDKKNPLLIRADYPNGIYNIIADLDGFTGSNKIKWQVEVMPVVVDPNIALINADLLALSLKQTVTSDFELPIVGVNGSNISWQSDSVAIAISGKLADVTRPEFVAGDAVVHLVATLSKGSITKTKLFDVTVLKNDQVIIPPTTGGGGGGVAGSVTPQSINAINFPLSLISSQNGVLTQSFANGLSARLVVSPNAFTGNAIFRIAEGPEGDALGGRHFELTATDSNGNPVRNFNNNLNITFSGLPLSNNVSGLGVYYYDEALLSWVLVPGAVFDQAGGSVSFSVNHLTNFAVFSEQPVTQEVLGETTYADGTLLRGSDKRIFVVIGGKLQRILNLKELAQYADQEILEVEDSVIAAYAKFSAQQVLGETTYADGTLLRGSDAHIFVVIGGKLQRILNLKELAQYADQEILEVEDSVIAAYAKVSSKAVLGVRKYNFSRDLKTGVISDDVQELQRYLNDNGYIVSKTGPGSIGQETKKFGRATREALIKFQKDNKISPAVGYFGPLTRQVVNR
jgi:hypothetical protein